jgi:hypothetical protein
MLTKSSRLICCFCLLLCSTMTAGSQTPSPVKEYRIAAGKTADLWLGVNVTGTIYYAIASRDGSNKMRMWWVTEPLGHVTQLGTLSGRGSLKIPDKLKASISAKLRGSATSDTVVDISENVKIDNSVTFHW